ncbi:3'-5' exoribonuclease CSL4-like protein [Verticillium dahliae VDG2]|nr:3'-5' exoribonuclease CSL4-like protein [Verticillium dahliae VDG2]
MTSAVTPLVFHGPIIHSRNLEELEILENATLVIDASGTITALKKSEADDTPTPAVPEGARVHHLGPGEFLIPGFIDTHNHAPQWPMRGIGQGLHILDWLDQVTFPFEARFADAAYARATYEDTVADFLRQGITTASYYSSRHAEGTRILADICVEKGQRALVGKCNMDRNAPASLAEPSAAVMDGAAAAKALTLDEVFYLATLGGARVLCLEHHVGSFAVGKQFDASWVATTSGLRSAMTPREDDDGLRRIFEKFVMTGDDRNMAHVYVRGRRVAGARHGEAS